MKENIGKNIEDVMRRIETAAVKSGRSKEDIKIIVVTKTIGTDMISKVLDENITELGENRVQELLEKYSEIKKPCNWHMIGHLQKNKVKYIIDKVVMIHSVDSYELAAEIQKQAQKAGVVMDVLVEVNIAAEESKFGVAPDDVQEFVEKISVFPNIRVKGLMTVAPFVQNPEEIRHVFKEIYNIFVDIRLKSVDNVDMDCISAGMSNDFEVAIEEGANMVRIGTSIFGKRY